MVLISLALIIVGIYLYGKGHAGWAAVLVLGGGAAQVAAWIRHARARDSAANRDA